MKSQNTDEVSTTPSTEDFAPGREGTGLYTTDELHPPIGTQDQSGLFCPNCGAPLEGRKCKLFCHTPGCGYLVTCSEW
jgi:hypothetical protein